MDDLSVLQVVNCASTNQRLDSPPVSEGAQRTT